MIVFLEQLNPNILCINICSIVLRATKFDFDNRIWFLSQFSHEMISHINMLHSSTAFIICQMNGSNIAGAPGLPVHDSHCDGPAVLQNRRVVWCHLYHNNQATSHQNSKGFLPLECHSGADTAGHALDRSWSVYLKSLVLLWTQSVEF